MESSGDYERLFTTMQEMLASRLSGTIKTQMIKYKIRGNHMEIDCGFPGSHYEVCFRGQYHEIALHFQSSDQANESRLAPFLLKLEEISQKLGRTVKAGKLEHKGWKRLWIELPVRPLSQDLLTPYSDLMAKMMVETLPVLRKAYST
jgi:hypothetical protein